MGYIQSSRKTNRLKTHSELWIDGNKLKCIQHRVNSLKTESRKVLRTDRDKVLIASSKVETMLSVKLREEKVNWEQARIHAFIYFCFWLWILCDMLSSFCFDFPSVTRSQVVCHSNRNETGKSSDTVKSCEDLELWSSIYCHSENVP